jgi:hypothetical protein
MSPKKHSEKLKTWFHAQNNKFYTIIGTSNKSEDVIALLCEIGRGSRAVTPKHEE